MRLKLDAFGVIEEQEIVLSKDVGIIYGYNNCGKTTLLKMINEQFDRICIEAIFHDGKYVPSIYIPTNRVVVSEAMTEMKKLRDTEDFINYKRDMYQQYDLHLRQIREYLFAFEIVRNFVINAVERMFHFQIDSFAKQYSDGIENIINIYVNIIWVLTWHENLSIMSEADFAKLMSQNTAYILIDEIEMFLHVSIQSRLIECLTSDFKQCRYIFSTHSPLLLTRYKDSQILQIEHGRLKCVSEDMYFKDLDTIYEGFFKVMELPEDVKDGMNYLGSCVFGEETADKDKVEEIIQDIESQYPNIRKKYNRLIVKAKDKVGLFE